MRALVLRGGPDAEREVSLASGAAVVDGLRDAGVDVDDAVIGRMTYQDLRDLAVRRGASVVFPVLHGPWGEGGALQEMLERLEHERGVGFVGSGASAARAAMDKVAGKAGASRVIDGEAVRVAPHAVLGGDGHGVRDQMGIDLPVVVKPTREGSSVGAHVCRDAPAYAEAMAAVRADLACGGGAWMVEPMIAGREVTASVLDRGSGLEALPIVEVVAPTWFDFEAKYESERTRFVVAPEFEAGVIERMQRAALAIAREMGVRHLGRADFMVDRAGVAWFLEMNTMPGFTSKSLLPMAAQGVGLGFAELCAGLVAIAAGGPGGDAARRRGGVVG